VYAKAAGRPLFKKEPIVFTLFKQVHQSIIKWKNVKASATQNCIVYVAQTTFLIIRPMKSALDIKFYLSEQTEEFPVYKTEVWGKRIGHFIRLFDESDIDDAVWSLLKRSTGKTRTARLDIAKNR
jgi:hypothetical protein